MTSAAAYGVRRLVIALGRDRKLSYCKRFARRSTAQCSVELDTVPESLSRPPPTGTHRRLERPKHQNASNWILCQARCTGNHQNTEPRTAPYSRPVGLTPNSTASGGRSLSHYLNFNGAACIVLAIPLCPAWSWRSAVRRGLIS